MSYYDDIEADCKELRRQLDVLKTERAKLLVNIQHFQKLSAEAKAVRQELEESLEHFATMKAAMTTSKMGGKGLHR